jgi:phenylpyruvate tautomerase PptA (4-oxalocrotonate tautomerase family)
MPNIFVKVPEGVFSSEQISELAQGITLAACEAESTPEDNAKRMLTWVVVDETPSKSIFIGGQALVPMMIPVMVRFCVPEGVFDEERKRIAVEKIHSTILSVASEEQKQVVLTSIIIDTIGDGDWGCQGEVWTLPKFAAAAGYEHLQHLVSS